MKKVFIFAALAVLTVNVFAQTAFDYLIDSLANVLAVSSIVRIDDYEYNGVNALWGAYLEPGKKVSHSLQYDAGIEYLMIASAHNAKADVFLKVYRGQGTGGTVVGKDTTSDAAPVVRFTPSASGWHTFELINSGNIPAFVSLVVLKQKKNSNFNLITLAEALQNTKDVSRHITSLLPPNSGIPVNKWTLFGGNIKKGSSASYSNARLSKGVYILAGSGEYSINNCDAEIIEQYTADNPDGRKISQNTGAEFPYDFAVFSPNPSKYHYLKVINQESIKESAFLFGFLILTK